MVNKVVSFSLFAVMNQSPGHIANLTVAEQQQDEIMNQIQTFQKVHLADEDVICEHVHSSLVKANGIIIQYFNANATGATTNLGGVRIGLQDVRKAPAYVAKHKDALKQHGIRMLARHFLDTQCAAGAGETLSKDDYGISFSLASVSPAAVALNPTRRHEGPLFFCLFSGLTDPTCLSEVSWDDGKASEAAHVLNAYIHLLPQSQRRHRVLMKAKTEVETSKDDDEMAKNAKKPRTFFQPNDVPRYNQGAINYRGYQERKIQEEFDMLRAELVAVKSQATQDIAAIRAQSALNPALPKSKINWPPKDPNQGPDLPDEV